MQFFTLGGVLSRAWRPAYPLLPWALTSALLMVLGIWDHLVDRSPIEWSAVGLSAYEMMMGLLRTSQTVHAPLRSRADIARGTPTIDER